MQKTQLTVQDRFAKTGSKEKITTITLTGQYYRERLELVGYEQSLIQKVRHMEDAKRSSPYTKQI
jgi:hypothetical protein